MVNRMNRMNNQTPPQNSHGGCTGNKALLSKLQAVDFSMVDTVLYLDAYPECKKALAYYRQLLSERSKLLAELEKAGIPISNMAVTSGDWNWTNAPWPWEYEANI